MTVTTETNDPTPFLFWDTGAIVQRQAYYLVETGEAADVDEGFTMAFTKSDCVNFAWEDLIDCLTDTLNDINPEGYWHAEVINFGWRSQQGFTNFKATDGKTWLSRLLPNTECIFNVYLEPDNTLRIQNYHHDAPTGNEWYTITAISETVFAEAA